MREFKWFNHQIERRTKPKPFTVRLFIKAFKQPWRESIHPPNYGQINANIQVKPPNPPLQPDFHTHGPGQYFPHHPLHYEAFIRQMPINGSYRALMAELDRGQSGQRSQSCISAMRNKLQNNAGKVKATGLLSVCFRFSGSNGVTGNQKSFGFLAIDRQNFRAPSH